ncbi:exodeoxyribonuclease V subunit beta [Pantoea sp. Aalb]|uniref:exodeoxyribonuclease V subunit beta n=1 Tax=Pantoea sp. Aalb TaxID=2576762 RepID=UPI0013279EBC|nr:exodeoxyribonuclease V subunit beta [Pantoea sp. Aalb]MXP67747.1 exodeoxyribonuclease V subunit beta [Pantoea sp. Aalb]
MIIHQYESLNPFILPLRSSLLIEASAGTGKTFTIVLLYLRLLLRLGNENAYVRPLSIEEILVVTFTEAATSELRERIRENIHELRLACIRGYSNNVMLMELLKYISNTADAISLLLIAESQIDKAAIFTIHGFCQRMINFNAFESKVFFKHKLIENEELLLKQATADFWRYYCYPLKQDIIRVIVNEWKGPEQLFVTLKPLLQGKLSTLSIIPKDGETLELRHDHNLSNIINIKQHWLKLGKQIITLISDSDIDKRSYSNKYLLLWFNQISKWAKSETNSYDIPNNLFRFGQKALQEKTKKNGVSPYHLFFLEIDQFLKKAVSLRDLVIILALKYVRYSVQKEKESRALLGFDDLLIKLDAALQLEDNKDQLAQSIRMRFPVALIDEFQDTDPIQYRIFHKLYMNQRDHILLLIGDPKQAIYAFRGADVFTYIKARNEIKKHYTLGTNWRSSAMMIDSINTLFSQVEMPFLFKDIPFCSVKFTKANHLLTLKFKNCLQPALRFWLHSDHKLTFNEHQNFIAQKCALDISYWIHSGNQKQALLGKIPTLRPIQASDITVLVRNRSEANLIRDALNQVNIPSVYLSNSDTIYMVTEARELLWLLQAVLEPEQGTILRTALATSLLAFNALQIDNLISYKNQCTWHKIVDMFTRWRLVWEKHGILPMIHTIIQDHQLAEETSAFRNIERRLINLLHLGELLQEASIKMNSLHALVRYLSRQISLCINENNNENNKSVNQQQLRSENNINLIKIVTIYKAKGLQYPLVWFPFATGFREINTDIVLYHDRKYFNSIIDLNASNDILNLAQQEKLSEDLRLLYVALTRSIYHCSVGIIPYFQNTIKKNNKTDFHKSALGYLLQRGKAATEQQLIKILENIKNTGIDVVSSQKLNVQHWKVKTIYDNHSSHYDNPLLNARKVTRKLTDSWCISSYTSLYHQNTYNISDTIPNFGLEFVRKKSNIEQNEYKIESLTPHDFPRGVKSGIFLHEIFQSLDFMHSPSKHELSEHLSRNGYSLSWQPMLNQWVTNVLNVQLNKEGIKLFELSPNNRLIEMTFYFPINHLLEVQKLDEIMRYNDSLSAEGPILNIPKIYGMLKGCIDLVFRWHNKYYILDYKSNWLGSELNSYNLSAMRKSMITHRYDLQYQLYTLALHRYLKYRMPNYNYEEHFGGVFYLFLRGINVNSFSNGIFYIRPTFNCISKLDNLLNSHSME